MTLAEFSMLLHKRAQNLARKGDRPENERHIMGKERCQVIDALLDELESIQRFMTDTRPIDVLERTNFVQAR